MRDAIDMVIAWALCMSCILLGHEIGKRDSECKPHAISTTKNGRDMTCVYQHAAYGAAKLIERR